jgi:hypothetical protein
LPEDRIEELLILPDGMFSLGQRSSVSEASRTTVSNVYWRDAASEGWTAFEGAPPNVRSLMADGAVIYFVGQFDAVNGTSGYHNIARYDQTTGTWSKMGGGVCATSDFEFADAVYSYINTLAVAGGEIVIGGHFNAIGR